MGAFHSIPFLLRKILRVLRMSVGFEPSCIKYEVLPTIINRAAIATLQFWRCPHLVMICTDTTWTDYLAPTIAYLDKMKSNFTDNSRDEFEKLLRGRWCVYRQSRTLQFDRSIRTARLPHKYVKLFYLHHEFEKFLKGSLIDIIGKVRNGNADRIIGDPWLVDNQQLHRMSCDFMS